MKNYFLPIVLIIFLVVTACQTVQNKSDKIIKEENEKLSKFIGQPENELKIVMGVPDDEAKNETGAKLLIYEQKKFGITCKRTFEINDNGMVVGFTSKGCF